MEEVFPLTEPINLLTPRFGEEDLFMSRQYIPNYGTNLNQYQYNSNQSSNVCRNNTCTNVNCSPIPSKKYEYRRDSDRRHSAHGRISSSGILN